MSRACRFSVEGKKLDDLMEFVYLGSEVVPPGGPKRL